jgi:hypothetical protein
MAMSFFLLSKGRLRELSNWLSPGKRRFRQFEVLLYFSEFATYQAHETLEDPAPLQWLSVTPRMLMKYLVTTQTIQFALSKK